LLVVASATNVSDTEGVKVNQTVFLLLLHATGSSAAVVAPPVASEVVKGSALMAVAWLKSSFGGGSTAVTTRFMAPKNGPFATSMMW